MASTLFKKYFKGKIRTVQKRNSRSKALERKVLFGDYSLKAGEACRLTPKQLDATRRTIKKLIKPVGGVVKMRVRAFLPVSSKPLAVRMGRGKGKVALNVAPVKKGTTLFEIYCSNSEVALEAARQGAFRLPGKTLIVRL